MRQLTLEIFDEIVSGTGQDWYTSASHNDLLGSADALILQAVATGVSGTSPTLTCELEHSGDGRKWNPIGPDAEIDGESIEPPTGSDRAVLIGRQAESALGFIRVRVRLGGTNPECRLRITATGRVSRTAPAARMANQGLGR